MEVVPLNSDLLRGAGMLTEGVDFWGYFESGYANPNSGETSDSEITKGIGDKVLKPYSTL